MSGGCLLLLVLCGIFIYFAAGKFIGSAMKDSMQVAMDMATLREQIMQYKKDTGKYPDKLEDLVPEYLPDPTVLTCPLSGPSVPVGFEYYGGKDTDPGSNILLVSKGVSRGRQRVVVHVDSSAQVERDMPELPPHRR